jgi:predicted tellurium resistance membrane protein TerC
MDLLTVLRTLGDRVLAWGLIAAGVLALLLGYLGVKDTAYVVEQLPYIISGGLFGLFLLGVGAMLLLSADLRDQWRALLDIRDELAQARVAQAEQPSVEVRPAPQRRARVSRDAGRKAGAGG